MSLKRTRARLSDRLRAELPAKLLVWIGLAIGICVPYFGLQALGLSAPQPVPVTALDRWIAFAPGWAYPYATLALLVPLAPLLAGSRRELARYAVGLALLCGASFLTYLLFPVAGPRPGLRPESGLYTLLVSVDAPTNCLPSLHAGLTVYSFLFLDRVLHPDLAPAERLAWRTVAWLWGAAVLYSTLATKQHWLVDLPPAVLLAWLAHRATWASAGPRRP